MDPLSKAVIRLLEARLAWEALPFVVFKTGNGWAAYKGDVRITKFYFSEDGAREAAIAWEAVDVKVTW